MRTPSSGKLNGDRLVEAYYADMGSSLLVPQAEEPELVKAYRTCAHCGNSYPLGSPATNCNRCGTKRNFQARDRLISGALRFVVKMAKDYAYRTRGPNYESELLTTLISVGNIGLLVAADRFDVTKKTKFITYAAWWVREKILEELDSQGLIRVPVHKQKALRAQRKYGAGTEVEAPHVTLDTVEAIDSAGHSDQTLEQGLFNKYGLDMLRKALDYLALGERDKYIVLAYYGTREDPKTLRQISRRIDLSSERVRQLKQDTLLLLKGYLENNAVERTEDVYVE